MWSDEQKRAAVEAVLRSTAFARSDQLRSFLKYVCEMEIAGRSAELNEYMVGVEALGKPASFSTGSDSTVRSRAHTLRAKLQEYYEKEAPDAPLRIDLPKGSYAPRFVEAGEREAEVAARRWTPRVGPAAALAIGIGLGLALAGGVWLAFGGRSAAVPAVLREAWGPMAGPGAGVAIVLAAPAHLAVFAYPETAPTDVISLPLPPDLLSWYTQHYFIPKDSRLLMHGTTNSVQMGNVAGGAALIRMLNAFGTDYQLLADAGLPVSAIRDRHVLLLGNSEYSHTAETLLDRAVLSVRYDAASRERAVVARAPGGGYERRYLPQRDSRDQQAAAFGLITVLPAEGPSAGSKRMVVFSGTSSAAVQSAAEYFCSAHWMADLRARFVKEGHRGFPQSYQVVVRCRTDNVRPLGFSHESHMVIRSVSAPDPPAGK